jgi:thiamine biosynthesis protein ThiI
LEQRLIDDLKFALRRSELDCSRVEKEAARLVVFGSKRTQEAAKVCSKVFGVAYAAPAELLTNPTLEDITESIAKMASRYLSQDQSFAVRAHRSTTGAISARDIELKGGSRVLKEFTNGVRVDLGNPDHTFYVDLVGNDAFVYREKLRGPSGLPLSAQWKMLGVLDRGPFSILAAVAMMRRGCTVELLIPVSDTIGEFSPISQMNFAEKLGRLVTRPNYKALMLALDELPQGLPLGRTELVRRLAVRIAREKHFKGVVFGDVSGDLSSLLHLGYGNQNTPVFYPLLGFDWANLEDLARLAGIDGSALQSQRESFQEEIGQGSLDYIHPTLHEVSL